MSNKKQKTASGELTSPSATKSQVKREVSELNRQIEQLCHQRAATLRQLQNIEDARAVLRAARGDTGASRDGGLSADELRGVFRDLDSATLALWRKPRVAFLGPEFSYSHIASIHRFGTSAELLPTSSISGVFEAVQRGDADFGLVPIENSTDGRIVDTLDMFVRLPLQVCGEVPLRIHHNLLSQCELSEIREVQSKPQALSQCRMWLARHLPKAQLVAATSTTAAAEAASREPGIAAIASKQAGTNYGLRVVAANIEDNPDNVTRFAVIGAAPSPRTGNDKTSLMFEVAHQPGSLADVMMIFKRNRLNLTWIESFPKKGSQNEYLFFVELEGHHRDAAVKRALQSLAKKTVHIELLGSYAREKIAD